ncbi:hypothetical protein MNBD_ALPHA07-2074 [hydrothermal vent metagenome]|uniref:Uncharacterized protein n=1 Tax=hydrothermal vent metagenome TaxID=652676 RepID=A0A3B0RLV3_9ZZZZ
MTSGLLPAAFIAIFLNLILPQDLADDVIEEPLEGLGDHGQP